MSDVQRVAEDLRFVRETVARHERQRGAPSALAYVWAAYVLIGYALIDQNLNAAVMFFAIGGVAGAILSWWLAKAYVRRTGESDRTHAARAMAHFGGGIAVAWACCIALAVVIAPLRGTHGSQVFVVMIGLIYFLWGIHQDRYYLFLGPILMVGGVLVSRVPHYGWTMLGAVIALGLIAPTFFQAPRGTLPPSAAAA